MSESKQLKRIAVVLFLATMGLFASCTKEAGYMDQLLGKWQQTVATGPNNEELDLTIWEPHKYTVEFKNNGTFIVTQDLGRTNPGGLPSSYTGTFHIKDNQLELLSLTMNGETFEGDCGKFLITEVNASFLSLKALTLSSDIHPEHGYVNILSVTEQGDSKYKRLTTRPLF